MRKPLAACVIKHCQRHWGLSIALAFTLYKLCALLLYAPLYMEDATKHLAVALEYPWYAAILKPLSGYYSLYNNVIASVVAATPLAWWATEISAIAFVSACACLIIPAISCSSLWPTRWQQNLIPLIIVLIGLEPSHQLIWLNLVNLQFFFCLAGVLILFSTAQTPKAAYVRNGLLGIAGLTGVTTAILAPFFLIKAFATRKTPEARQNLITAAIITLAAIIEAIVILNTDTSAGILEQRLNGISLTTYLSYIANRHIIPLFVPFPWVERTLSGIATLPSYLAVIVPTLALLLYLLPASGRALFAVTASITVFFFVTALGDKTLYATTISGNGRYTFATSALLLIMVLQACQHAIKPRLWQPVAAAIILLPTLLSTNLTPLEANRHSWQQEVATASTLPGYAIVSIWPAGTMFSYCNPSLCNSATRHDLELSYPTDSDKPAFYVPPKALLHIEVRNHETASLELKCKSADTTLRRTYPLPIKVNYMFLPLAAPGTENWSCRINAGPWDARRLKLRAYY